MKNKKTYYQLILDRSGSMSSCIEETVTGVNSQIVQIRELAKQFPEQELLTSFNLFNHNLTTVWDRLGSTEIKELSYPDFNPDGNTALLDAIGLTIRHLQDTIGEEVARDEASVVVVIFTDGYENASTQFKLKQISSLIKELELTGRWSFSYIGATLDAIEIAITLNIKRSNSRHFDVRDSAMEHNRVSGSMRSYMVEKREGRIKQDFLEDEEPKKV
jgi:uncharacterized protein YegL